MADRELESFKSEINLVEYADSCGYALIDRESSRNSAVMKSDDGDKIIVARNLNKHWIYFSVRDDSDNGTIIDFVLRRRAGQNLGRVRKELSGWLKSPRANTRQNNLQFDLHPSTKNRLAVTASFSTMREVADHPYLTGRGLTTAVIAHPRFLGRVFMDGRSNTIFPHTDSGGIVGYEIKNKNFTGFASGGDKALWISNRFPGDRRMVVAESAIDAMSHFVLNPWQDSFYVSTAGGWSPKTSECLKALAAQLPANGEVILAYDHDAQGLEYIHKTEELLTGIQPRIVRDLPIRPKTDWNDELQATLNRPPSKQPYDDRQRGESS